MAMKLNAGEVGRTDLFSILPSEIVVVPSENGRATPHSQEVIEAFAASILKNGQLQPVQVRRIDNNRVQLVMGYGRHAAVTYINTVLQPDNPIKLRCVVCDASSEEAFIKNLCENLERSDTTPVDDAHNQRRLREQYGWTDAAIATFYSSSVSHISRLRKVLSLASPIQASIAAGDTPLQAALDLAELPEAEHAATLTAATNPDTGKVSAEVVRKVVRTKRIADGTGAGKSRSLKEVRDFFTFLTGPAEAEPIRTLATSLLAYISGTITDEQMVIALDEASSTFSLADSAVA